MKFFIDIGNTNFKICDENDLVKIFSVNEFDNFLKSFNFKEHQLYVLNNNLKCDEILKEFLNDHLFIFDIKKYQEQFVVSKKFHQNEIGNDLWFLIYYLNKISCDDVIMISSGSCLVSIVKKQNQICSISINLGISNTNLTLRDKFNLQTSQRINDESGTATDLCISLGNYCLINGVIQTNTEIFSLHNPQIVVCGNDWDDNCTKKIIEKYPTTILKNNLVLSTFKNWCLDNNL